MDDQLSLNLKEKAQQARTALDDFEWMLREMIEKVYQSTPPRHIPPEEWTLDVWWRNEHRVPEKVRRDCEDFKRSKEQNGVLIGHAWECTSLWHFYRIIDANQMIFSSRLFYGTGQKIHDLLRWLFDLVQIRNRFAHLGKRPITISEINETLSLIHDILKIIPNTYHYPPNLYESIVTLSRSICQDALLPSYFNFPAQMKSFIGREAEINRIQQLVLKHRLVTLHGMGGVGKTHLAIHAVRNNEQTEKLAASFPNGIAFISLANVPKDSKALCQMIVRAIGKTDEDIRDECQLIAFLKSQRFLLLLDNWESVHAAETGGLIQQLLAQTQYLHTLITSQLPLGLEGIEQIEHIDPMPMQGDLDKLDAYHLFIERAQLKLGSNWRPNDTTALQEVLKYTDGIPLAIEFVAARAYERTLYELGCGLRESRNRLGILRRRARALQATPERHDSIEACFDWTYQLLPPEVQEFFPALGIFVGGFTAEAAACVGSAEVEPLLDALHDAALVQFNIHTGRYSLLPIVREYALDKTSDYIEIYRSLHAEYFKDLVKKHGDQEREDLQNQDMTILEIDLSNILAAMEFAYSSSDDQSVITYAMGLRHFFWRRGYWSLSNQPLHRGIEAARRLNNKSSEASLKHRLGVILDKQNHIDVAEKLHRDSLENWKEVNNLDGQAMALYSLGSIETERRNFSKAMEFYKESLALMKKTDHKSGQALALHQMGYTSMKNDVSLAEGFYMHALEIREEINDYSGVEATLRNIGDLFLYKAIGNKNNPIKNKEELCIASDYYQRSLEISKQTGNRQGMAATFHRLGRLAVAQKDDPKARLYFEHSLEIKKELGNYQGEAATLKELGHLEKRESNLPAAIQYWNRCLTIFEERESREAENVRKWLFNSKQEIEAKREK